MANVWTDGYTRRIQARGCASLARSEAVHYAFFQEIRNPKRERGRVAIRIFLAYASGYEKCATSKLTRRVTVPEL